jgi:hypothetical protein
LRSSAVTFDLIYSMVAKRVALRPIFRAGYSQSNSERDPESTVVGWWCFGSAYNYWTTGDVLLCALSWCRNHVPATCRFASSEPHHVTSEKLACRNDQQLSLSLSLSLPKRYELMMHQTVNVKEFCELFDCPSYA